MKYILDGVDLNDSQLRWFPDRKTGVRIAPARQITSIAYPHTDGEAWQPGAHYDPSQIVVNLNIAGADHYEFMRNYEFMLGLMSQRHKLMDFRHIYDFGSNNFTDDRIAPVELVSLDEVKLIDKQQGSLEAMFRVPSVFWRGVNTITALLSPLSSGGVTQTLSPFNGGTAPISDGIIRLKGGFSTARIVDTVSKRELRITAGITDSQYLVIDCARWEARVHNTDSWSLTSGTNFNRYVVPSHGHGSMFTIEPAVNTSVMQMQYRVTVSATNITGSPFFAFRAKNSYL